MLSLEEIQDALSDRNIQEVARRVQLDPDTVYRYAKGEVTRPSHRAVIALSDYLSGGTNNDGGEA